MKDNKNKELHKEIKKQEREYFKKLNESNKKDNKSS